MKMAESPRVLSIQSHVVHGYVGNKSATFPLQLLGFEVDAINSVQFSNHTGYKKTAGQILNELDLGELAKALEENEIDNYSHLLTGYIGSVSFLKRISSLVQHLRTINPKLIYVCDPVMGDNGKMYVPAELLPVYKDIIIPLADIITPNQYELELLTKKKINNVNDAWNAIELLHESGCKTIVVSSSELGDKTYLLAIASQKLDDSTKRVTVKIPKLSASFTGSGDLFAALFLASMYKTHNNLKESIENTISILQAVLKRTISGFIADENKIPKKPIELKLIQSKTDIENPRIVVTAEEVL